MRGRTSTVMVDAVRLLLYGLLAGLVVAVAVFPMAAMSGLAAKAGAETFESLPAAFEVLPAPQMSYVYAADGRTLLATMFDENRRDVPLEQVSPVLAQAVVAAEDARFYQHRGVDLKGVVRAFVANQHTADAAGQGASTLTMQLVRLLISYSARTPQDVVDATERTPARKLREMRYAVALEKRLSKQQILERYLNIASYGHGAYGIFAAAHVYFDKDPKDLTLPEAALLAGLLKAPGADDPATASGRPRAVQRMGYVLQRMVELGYISRAQSVAARGAALVVVGRRTPEGCAAVQRPQLGAGFFCDYLRRWWTAQPALGTDEFERENRLQSGGYTIVSSLDLATQTAAATYAQDQPGIPHSDEVTMGSRSALMLAAIEPGTGRVRALATNRVFSDDQSHNGANTNPDKRGQKGNWPNTTVPIITGGPDVPGYQAGSSFKVFTAVAAVEAGYPLAFPIDVQSPFRSNFTVGRDDPTACDGNHYCPRNAGDTTGTFDMWTGFGRSVNTFWVPLEQLVGVAHVVDVAKRLGIQFRSAVDADLAARPGNWGAFTLGVSATTPLELANAYATLAADGTYCEPTPVVQITDPAGDTIDAANPRCRSVVDPQVARAVVDLARCPVGDQAASGRCDGATAPYVKGIVNRPIAGKTGTTDGEKSATFVAMTRQLAVAGFLTDPDWPDTTVHMKHPPVNRAVAATLRDGLTGLPVVGFTAPDRNHTYGTTVAIPRLGTCSSVAAATATLRRAGFTVAVSPRTAPSACPAGTVTTTSPSRSTVQGGTVTLILSKGPASPSPSVAPSRSPPRR